MTRRTPRHSHRTKTGVRCQYETDVSNLRSSSGGTSGFEKCNKLAKDVIDDKFLCRIHSPIREGYIFKKIKKAKEARIK